MSKFKNKIEYNSNCIQQVVYTSRDWEFCSALYLYVPFR
jgi:hypothetical protein